MNVAVNSGTLSEEDLINGIKAQNTIALQTVYNKYSGALYATISRILDNEDADEVLAAVFLKIWKSIDEYDSNAGTFFTWMFNVTRSHTLEYLYLRKHPSNADIKLETKNDFEIFSKPGAEVGYNEVLKLTFSKGHTFAEAAELLHIPLETVKLLVRKGMLEMRSQV